MRTRGGAMKAKQPKQSVKRKKVDFYAVFPHAREVGLAGDFNNWDPEKHPMKKGENGRWEKYLLLYPGTYEYKFSVDGRWEMDPKNPLVCPNTYGTKNNFIVV